MALTTDSCGWITTELIMKYGVGGNDLTKTETMAMSCHGVSIKNKLITSVKYVQVHNKHLRAYNLPKLMTFNKIYFFKL